ncbi:hypothetical protein ACXET9_07380 [Brachybacterium sp. DNPG3]
MMPVLHVDGPSTGWRAIELAAPYPAGTTVWVQRVPGWVIAAHGSPEASATWAPGITKGSGISTDKAWTDTGLWTPDRRAVEPIFHGGTGAVVGAVGWSTEVGGFLGLTHTASSAMVFCLVAPCSQPMPDPATLPGAAVSP